VPTRRLASFARRADDIRQEAATLARLTAKLPAFLRTPLSADETRALLRSRLQHRERRLLTVVERAIYDHPASPYRWLLRQAGCERGDFRALVEGEGVEGALGALAERGVYVTFDELKGRRAVVRGSQQRAFDPSDFDSPLVRPHFARFTGGSGGRPSRVPVTLALVAEQAVSTGVVLEAHGIERAQHACWWPVPINWLLLCAKLGQPTVGWYYPVHPLPPPVSLMARYLRLYGRLAGHAFPLPERCDLDRPERLVAWLADRLASGQPLVLRTMPSAAARLGVAAQASGHDLTGLTIVMGAEPVTDARRQQVEASGARAVVLYGSVETSGLAYSCATPTAADDVHVMLDRFALAQHRRAAIAGGPVVDSLLVTSLSPAAGTIAFNTEMGDYARLERRACGCLLGQLGLTMHLSEIRSFEKLTGEGVTFASSNLQQILEEVLPARFGGTSLDYQLAEEETSDGAARLVLRVHPSVGELDADLVRAVLLEELSRGSAVERYHVQVWRAAGTVEVRRVEPRVTRAGKVLPFHLLRQSEDVLRGER
jgi:hypothetical protein